jgi:cytochrome c-type biogenesis protein
VLSISIPLAFLAGFLSFVSPCVLPLVPVYLSYLSGSSLSAQTVPSRRTMLGHAVLFVAGFTLVFIVLFGLPTTLLGSMLQQNSRWLARLGGVAVILFGLHTIGVIRVPWLNVTRRADIRRPAEPGYARSTLFGATFAAGWTPCIGPLLGTVMTMAFMEPSRAVGFVLIYALGLATPFLITAALLTRGVGLLKRLNRHLRAVELASGTMMVAVGLLLVSGWFSLLNSYFFSLTPDWLLRYL